MTQLLFLTVGTLKEDYLKSAYAEYRKRMGQFARVEEINIKEELIRNEDDPSEISGALEAEGKKLLAAIPKDFYKIALCVEGKELSSPELAKAIEAAQDTRGKIAFIIGSSYGLSPEVKAAADFRLSVSRLTFPHQLMRVILAETVYRAFTILAGKRYHK